MRSQSGFSLVEMLIASTIMSFVSLAFAAILLANFKTNAKITGAQDTIAAVRMVKERIGKDVREGRSLGDVFGQPTVDALSGTTMVTGAEYFPSASDPVYGAGQAPPFGWPSLPNNAVGKPAVAKWQLSNTCLIVQEPVTDNHADNGATHVAAPNNSGWPTCIPAAGGVPVQDNVETHIYEVVADANNANEWLLRYVAIPGRASAGASYTYNPSAHQVGPVTILSGIVGPLDGAGNPKVFQYINKNDATGTPIDAPTGATISEYTGVLVNLEVRKHQETNTAAVSTMPIGMKIEVFLRNNALATTTGMPASAQ